MQVVAGVLEEGEAAALQLGGNFFRAGRSEKGHGARDTEHGVNEESCHGP